MARIVTGKAAFGRQTAPAGGPRAGARGRRPGAADRLGGTRSGAVRPLACALALLTATLLALVSAPVSEASFQLVSTFGEGPQGYGEPYEWLKTPLNANGVAANEASGDVYVADNQTLMRFSAQGSFESKAGYDVVAHGPDNSANDHVERITVQAAGGTFKLVFATEATAPLPFDASDAEVKAALDALRAISGAGAFVSVTGGPGDETGSHPYEVTLEGNLGGDYFGEDKPYADGAELTGPSHQARSEVAKFGGGPEICEPAAGDACAEGLSTSPRQAETALSAGEVTEAPGSFEEAKAVAVDQATGDVYVADSERRHGVVGVFGPRGEHIASFGEQAEPGKSVDESPEEIHMVRPQDIAVDPSSGDVYLLDYSPGLPSECRVMIWRSKGIGPESYEYAGQSSDLFRGQCPASATQLVRDKAGDFFLASDSQIFEFDASNLSSPARKFNAAEAQLHVEAATAGPQSGEVTFYDYKHNDFRELGLGEGGKLVQAGEFPGPPGYAKVEVVGTAYDGSATWSAGRPAGVFYALATMELGVQMHPLIYAPEEQHPPSVDAESAGAVGTAAATLKATLDANGFATTYRFQYGSEGPCSTHECTEAPLGGAALGEAAEERPVAVTLSGLAPATKYYWRVVAKNAYGTVAGEDRSFETFPATAPGSPDNRAYEMVSPAEKFGGEVFPLNSGYGSCRGCEPGEVNKKQPMQSAPDGQSVVYEGYPFASSGDAVDENEYRSVRTAAGWRTEPLFSELEQRGSSGYNAFSADLRYGVFGHVDPPLASGAPEGYEDLYLRGPGGALTPLLTSAPPNRPPRGSGAGEFLIEQAGAAADFSKAFFAANDALTAAGAYAPAAVDPCAEGTRLRCSTTVSDAEYLDLYEWAGGALALVNVLPGNAATAPDAAFGSGFQLRGGDVGGGDSSPGPDFAGAVSADGTRAYWTDLEDGHLYVRLDGRSTVAVPDPASCARNAPIGERVCFLAASVDGGRVLLTDGHLYGIREGGESFQPVADLSQGQSGFKGVLGYDETFSTFYFVDSAALTPAAEANQRGEHAVAGADNLYMWHAGATAFVAGLSPKDNEEGLTGDWQPQPSDRLAQVSPDGRFLAFTSFAPLTGYDNRAEGGNCRSGLAGPCPEVYEYDSATHQLTCASCDPTGLPPTGGAQLSLIDPLGTKFPQPHNLLADGRLFFDSYDALSPYDQRPGILNVYEYEHDGQGSCGLPLGCVLLISSGRGAYDSIFMDASASGNDVFFTTRERLVTADEDDLVDLYDARVGGGFSEPTPPQCSGSGCQGAPNAPPFFATPATVTFAGAGNPQAPSSATKAPRPKKTAKCPRGARQRHGKCVKRRSACRKVKKRKGVRCVKAARKADAGRAAGQRAGSSAGRRGR